MSGDLGNSYNIDIWGLLIALGMVAVAAIISELMHMGIGKTLMWSSCRALVQLCAMGFIIGYVIRSNNVWMVFSLMAVMPASPHFHRRRQAPRSRPAPPDPSSRVRSAAPCPASACGWPVRPADGGGCG